MTTPTSLWSTAGAAQATGGISAVDWNAMGVSIDSRTLQPGDLFVALNGPNFDGHTYVADALANGAAAAMVSKRPDGVSDDVALLEVADTMSGLEQLGIAARARTAAKVAAVTGSVGKTGVKEALAFLLSRQGKTSHSLGSLNNHWGVPLSLARLPADAAYGVFELGMNHAGELTPLSQFVRPLVVIITTVEPAHLEFFDSVEDIARAKAEIFAGLQAGGTAILNKDNAYYAILEAEAHKAGAEIIGFGEAADAEVRLTDFTLDAAGADVSASFNGQNLDYRLNLPGRHWVQNSLAVLAAVQALGANLDQAAQDFADVALPKGRGLSHRISRSGMQFTLIDDSYNASPVSIAAALAVLSRFGQGAAGRRIAVLGDMLELGDDSPDLHEGLAEPIAANSIDLVYAAGDRMKDLFDVLPDRVRGGWAAGSAELLSQLEGKLQDGDVVLVKGSAGARMGLIVDALLAGQEEAGAQETDHVL